MKKPYTLACFTVNVNFRKGCLYDFLCLCVKIAISVSLRILYGLPKTMRKGLLYTAGKEPVKDHKQDPYAFFTMSLCNHKFEISCCVKNKLLNLSLRCFLDQQVFLASASIQSTQLVKIPLIFYQCIYLVNSGLCSCVTSKE